MEPLISGGTGGVSHTEKFRILPPDRFGYPGHLICTRNLYGLHRLTFCTWETHSLQAINEKELISLVIFWNSCRHWTILADISVLLEKKISLTEMQLFRSRHRNRPCHRWRGSWIMSMVLWPRNRTPLRSKRPQDAWRLSCRNYPVLLWTGKYKRNELDFAIQGLKKILDL